MGNELIIGEPAGGSSERAEAVARLLADAEFDVTNSPDVRSEIWYKPGGTDHESRECYYWRDGRPHAGRS